MSFRQPKKILRVTEAHEARLMVERANFAMRYTQLLQQKNGGDIGFMDETTFSLWNTPTRTWMSAENQIAVPLNSTRLQSVTLYGAIGKCFVAPVYMMADSTCIVDFI